MKQIEKALPYTFKTEVKWTSHANLVSNLENDLVRVLVKYLKIFFVTSIKRSFVQTIRKYN